jgi:hypothetical protein
MGARILGPEFGSSAASSTEAGGASQATPLRSSPGGSEGLSLDVAYLPRGTAAGPVKGPSFGRHWLLSYIAVVVILSPRQPPVFHIRERLGFLPPASSSSLLSAQGSRRRQHRYACLRLRLRLSLRSSAILFSFGFVVVMMMMWSVWTSKYVASMNWNCAKG